MDLYKRTSVLILLIYGSANQCCGNIVEPTCSKDEPVCEYHLRLAEHFTMTYTLPENELQSAYLLPFKAARNGSLVVSEACSNVSSCFTDNLIKQGKVPAGDGSYKLVYLFNQSLPGPPMVVYEGQQVAVKVTNALTNGVTSVHWHGLRMRNMPWMDGVSGLSQCPILPGETFTYRFVAEKAGTFWYRSGAGAQRSMGAYGALIVLPRDTEQENAKRPKDPLPEFANDVLMTVSDWYSLSSQHISLLTLLNATSYYFGFGTEDEEKCYRVTSQADGTRVATVPWSSGLINGKGRFFDRNFNYYKERDQEINVPMETYHVTRGNKYRFRLINAAMQFSFRVAIDDHVLNVISSDGNDVVTTQVQSIIIASGERYDFWIDADQRVSSYWIRVDSLEKFRDDQFIGPGEVRGVLRYDGARLDEGPRSRRQDCSTFHPCRILNCPYSSHNSHFPINTPFKDDWFGKRQFIKDYLVGKYECIPLTDLRTPYQSVMQDSETVQEHILNFHLAQVGATLKPAINGIINKLPPSPLQVFGTDEKPEFTNGCPSSGDSELAQCAHVIEAELGSTVQLVFTVSVHDNSTYKTNTHFQPIHIHGHSVQLLKIGYPSYNFYSSLLEEMSADLRCVDERCYRVDWASTDAQDGCGLLKEDAPVKDTITVPAGGYAVTRFKADNPGYWLIGSQIEFFADQGMSVVIKVGNFSDMSPAPNGMNTCGDFDWSADDFMNLIKDKDATNAPEVTTPASTGSGISEKVSPPIDEKEEFIPTENPSQPTYPEEQLPSEEMPPSEDTTPSEETLPSEEELPSDKKPPSEEKPSSEETTPSEEKPPSEENELSSEEGIDSGNNMDDDTTSSSEKGNNSASVLSDESSVDAQWRFRSRSQSREYSCVDEYTYRITIYILMAATIVFFVLSIILAYKLCNKSHWGYTYIPSTYDY